jgi:hypothetical protein
MFFHTIDNYQSTSKKQARQHFYQLKSKQFSKREHVNISTHSNQSSPSKKKARQHFYQLKSKQFSKREHVNIFTHSNQSTPSKNKARQHVYPHTATQIKAAPPKSKHVSVSCRFGQNHTYILVREITKCTVI